MAKSKESSGRKTNRKRSASHSLPILGAAEESTANHAGDGRYSGPPPVVAFVSLGCAKNLVDSEIMLGRIAESGAMLTDDEATADTVVVNTCGFLGAAREEALGVIRELAERKRAGTLRRIVVAGCLVQRDGNKLLDVVPEIDALVGVNNRADVAGAVWRRASGAGGTPAHPAKARTHIDRVERYMGDYHPSSASAWSDQGRLRLTPRHYAYVRISEGCNQKCTFCTIPSIRGPMHSKQPEALVTECRELIADGARELILIGQDTTSYGVDLGGEIGLAGLLRRLNRECDGARWLRLMYVYPSILTDEMIETIAACERVVKYIDIPLQHINDRMLKAMGRRVTRAGTEALLDKLRRRIPGVTIRTTFIVGFPGETEEQYEELRVFVRDFGFDAVGTFRYSFEPETPSGRMGAQLDERVKQERYERLMLTQQERALAAARATIGHRLEVVVDGVDASGCIAARHAGQAPEVDAICVVAEESRGRSKPSRELVSGSVLQTEVVDTDGYDLVVVRAKSPASGVRTAGRRNSG